MQALMMAGSFTGPALGGVLADALSVRCAHVMLYMPRRTYVRDQPQACCRRAEVHEIGPRIAWPPMRSFAKDFGPVQSFSYDTRMPSA